MAVAGWTIEAGRPTSVAYSRRLTQLDPGPAFADGSASMEGWLEGEHEPVTLRDGLAARFEDTRVLAAADVVAFIVRLRAGGLIAGVP